MASAVERTDVFMARCSRGADTRRYFVRQPGVEAPRGCACYTRTALGRDRRVHRMDRTLYVRSATESRGTARRRVKVSPTPLMTTRKAFAQRGLSSSPASHC